MQYIHLERTYKAFFLFGGLGGAALGLQQSESDYRGVKGRFEILGSIDNDPDACADFATLTGVKAACLDLFDRDQYRDWHGKEPPADWQEVTLEQIRAAAQNQDPDLVVVTAPCKGLSGLLSQDKSDSKKYQALNRLTFRGVWLTLEAWRHNPPGVILFENVPRIATRGKKFLSEIKRLLAHFGYLVDDRHHDCGEIGGLAQHRRRYLLIARHASKLPSMVYNPPKQRVRAIGEVIEPMAMPDDPAAGPLHRMPRLQWRTWVRLALIPPGGDWRDLQGIEAGRYRITQEMNGEHTSKYRVYDANNPAGTVTGSDRLGSGAPSVADYRLTDDPNRRSMKYRIQDTADSSACIIGQTDVQVGAPLVADPRLGHTPMGNGKGGGAYHVQDVNQPAKTITADSDHRKSGGNGVIADPRIGHMPRDASMRVGDTGEPAGPVVGNAAVTSSNGIGAIADPRGLEHSATYGNMLRVTDCSDPVNTVTGPARP